MPKYFIFTHVLFIISCNNVYSMIKEFKYKPIIQPSECKIVREVITDWTRGEVSNNTIKHIITIVRKATPDEQEGRCIQYAINAITKNTAQIKLYTDATLNIDITNFFEQTDRPKKNDLVIYTKSKNNHHIKHFAIVIGHTNYESKWGNRTEIIQHDLFAIPSLYGKVASFWTLKKEFTSLEGRKLLPKQIKENISDHQKKTLEKQIHKKNTSATEVSLGKMFINLFNNKKI